MIFKIFYSKRTKALPDKSSPIQKCQGRQKPSRENDRADESPPVKITGRAKPSHEINKADESPPITKSNMYVKYLLFSNALNLFKL
jgi:hypothetical protein